MTKLEKMIKEYNAAILSKNKMTEDAERLRKDKARLMEEAETAAKAGNVAEYKEKKNAAELAEDDLFVKEKQIEGLRCFRTEDEAKDAWREFAEDYNKSFGKMLKAYEDKRKDLYAEFMKLVNIQNEMLKKREVCGDCCGLPRAYFLNNPADSAFPVLLLPDKVKTRTILTSLDQEDVNFFFAAHLAGERENGLWNSVIRLHVPYAE